MAVPFRYIHVTRQFIAEELADRVRRGENSVLLGHPFSGRTYICRELCRSLGQEIRGRVVQIDFAAACRVCDSEGLRDLIRLAVEVVQPQTLASEGLLGPLDSLGVAQPFLIAKNVDQLTHNLARQFLQEIRVAIQDRRLVVVLTGEHDLERMVHGPNSELDIDGRYVIQGFALDEFSRLLLRDRYTSTLRLEPIEETAKDIWSLTGGNTDLLRTILIALEDHRLAKDTGHEDPVATEWLSSWLQKPETVSQLA